MEPTVTCNTEILAAVQIRYKCLRYYTMSTGRRFEGSYCLHLQRSEVKAFPLVFLNPKGIILLRYFLRYYLPCNITSDLKFKSYVLQSINVTSKIKVLIQIFRRYFITYGHKTNIFSETHLHFYFRKNSLHFSTVQNIRIIYRLMLLFFNIKIRVIQE